MNDATTSALRFARLFALAYRLPGLPQRVILRLLTRCMSHQEFDKAVR
jgi:hypothetical protein